MLISLDRLALFSLVTTLAVAPSMAETPKEAEDAAQSTEIVVTAPRLRGSVDTDIPPDVILDQAAIESYGASSVTDLLAALSAQTRTGRGRGGGAPVVLVNGKRVSGFAEIRDLPSEAIQRVEILPEDVALRFGFSADQRVVNFILKDNFKAVSGEVEYGGPTAGGRDELELQTTFLKITQTGRINLSVQYDRNGSILERERNIVSSGVDLTNVRTLLPENEALSLNGTINRTIIGNASATLNLQYDHSDTAALFGLPLTGVDPLERNGRSRAFASGLTLDGKFGRWVWTATANHDRTTTNTLIDSITNGPRDRTRSRFTTTNGVYSLNGPLAELPAGQVTLNVRAGFDKRRIKGQSSRSGVVRQSLVRRSDANTRANLDIPLADRRRDVASAIGDLSINLNGAYRRLSDFGAITTYGYGLNWSPVKGVTLLASFAAEEAAPSPQQLGDPSTLTPNAIVFDFARGTTAIISQITGGNPALRAEERRDIKLGLSYNPPQLERLTLSANYFRNQSSNPISGFPALTLATERAFPGRITRAPDGQLLSVDQRPINFFSSRAEQLRWGFNFSREFGQQQGRGGLGGAGRDGAGGGGASGATPPNPGARSGGGGRPGGFGGGGGRFGGPGGQGGRWSVSLFHTIKFRDEIVTAAGAPVLDLLGGDTVGQNGGSPRHALDLEGGWFHKGFGVRVIGAYQGATQVSGGGLTDDLRFGSLATLNLRFFANLDQQKDLVKKAPFLKGSRVAFRVNNLFNAIQDVRDDNGVVPLRYQPGFVDPLGRTVEISFRKFF